MLRIGMRLCWMAIAIFFIAGCAIDTGARAPFNQQELRWQGRMQLKIQSDPAQAFSTNFDLEGDAQAGKLSLLTPLGSTAARLQWNANGATMASAGEEQQFTSIDALTRHATGSVIPIASLFGWLRGESPNTPGWQVELDDIAKGRLRAFRHSPEPPVELKIILDQ
jgi:outer membrane lipoprotein LolB